MIRRPVALAAVVLLTVVTGACGTGDDDASGGPTVVVTTDLLGDVVTAALGDAVDVITLMPPGADPHSFQASAQQAATMREATLLVVNGGGFEAGLSSVVASAESDGVEVFVAADVTTALADAAGPDPHFFSDPVRMGEVVEALVERLVDLDPDIDETAVRAASDSYVAALRALDDGMRSELDRIPTDDRTLVTNHDVFGAFADRYGFAIVGTIVPGGSTEGEVSGGRLDDLADTIRTTGVPAIFVDSSSSEDLARTLADEVGDVAVVELYSEALGPADSDGATYLTMMQTNARRIADALAPA